MKREKQTGKILKLINNYLVFFLFVAFVITCCTMLFVSILSKNLNITLTDENLSSAAKLTFLNVIFLSLLLTVLDSLRRKITVERPVKQITDAAEKIMKGDFSVRINQVEGFGADETFNEIVDCFNRMAEELGSVETLRTDFIANVSHELKTPLAVMQNYGALLQQPELDQEKRMEYATAVFRACRRLSSLVTNVLKLNKLENQQIFPQMTEYDLGEQLCESLLQFESEWEEKQINIETNIAEDITVQADYELLSLVWSNLLSNAFKFTDRGGCVSVSLEACGDHAVIKVTDTGCGMRAEVGAHIFEKFYQGDTSHSTQGNGLGLALVKRVIDIMKGDISVESVYGRGSTFTVRIMRSI